MYYVDVVFREKNLLLWEQKFNTCDWLNVTKLKCPLSSKLFKSTILKKCSFRKLIHLNKHLQC